MKTIGSLIVMLVLVLVGVCVAAEEPKDKEPREFTNLKAAYVDTIKDAVQPIQKKYIAQLETLIKQLGAAGKIEDATLVQKELQAVKNELDADKVLTRNGRKEKWSPVGRWMLNGGLCEIKADGALIYKGNEHYMWDVVGVRVIKVVWGGQGEHRITFAPDGKTFTSVRISDGSSTTGKKIDV